MRLSNIRCLVITGVTASGKTRLAVHLARKFQGEIISVDSRQVYRGLDLGTGKDLEEYGSGSDAIPVHLLDIVEPGEDFHLFRFLACAQQALLEVAARGKLPILAGGTPLYLQALLDGYDLAGGKPDPELRQTLEKTALPKLISMLQEEGSPNLFARTDLTQPRRVIRALEIVRAGEQGNPGEPLVDPLILAPKFPRCVSHQRIEQRLDERLQQGLIQEVQTLHEKGLSWEKLEWLGLEYRYVGRFLKGELSWQEMRQSLLVQIRHFCKRQDTWFRKMEREGKQIHWLPEGNPIRAEQLTVEWLQKTAFNPADTSS
ncbi:MAG: tRNA (adenosine(37)-N6)-dimethylallyltransferase MiaA [Lentisphaeria bacterium]